MKVLVIKMSSMGDVIHCLPAVTDLASAVPGVQIDWVVEEGFADIVRLHPAVNRVIPVAIRRWRKAWLANQQEVRNFVREIRREQYDVVIDAQGLIKSALVALLAKGVKAGFDRQSAREGAASMAYRNKIFVKKNQHAIGRQRQLFAAKFGYEVDTTVNYGLQLAEPEGVSEKGKTVFFLHATTWESKHWPEHFWFELALICAEKDYSVRLTYFGEMEQARAERIANAAPNVEIIPPGGLQMLAHKIAGSAGAIAVDTGLGHLAAACDVPLVGLYGPTSPELTGVFGKRQISLAEPNLSCAPCLRNQCRFKPGEHSSNIYPPCFAELTPERVFARLEQQMTAGR